MNNNTSVKNVFDRLIKPNNNVNNDKFSSIKSKLKSTSESHQNIIDQYIADLIAINNSIKTKNINRDIKQKQELFGKRTRLYNEESVPFIVHDIRVRVKNGLDRIKSDGEVLHHTPTDSDNDSENDDDYYYDRDWNPPKRTWWDRLTGRNKLIDHFKLPQELEDEFDAIMSDLHERRKNGTLDKKDYNVTKRDIVEKQNTPRPNTIIPEDKEV